MTQAFDKFYEDLENRKNLENYTKKEVALVCWMQSRTRTWIQGKVMQLKFLRSLKKKLNEKLINRWPMRLLVNKKLNQPNIAALKEAKEMIDFQIEKIVGFVERTDKE